MSNITTIISHYEPSISSVLTIIINHYGPLFSATCQHYWQSLIIINQHYFLDPPGSKTYLVILVIVVILVILVILFSRSPCLRQLLRQLQRCHCHVPRGRWQYLQRTMPANSSWRCPAVVVDEVGLVVELIMSISAITMVQPCSTCGPSGGWRSALRMVAVQHGYSWMVLLSSSCFNDCLMIQGLS